MQKLINFIAYMDEDVLNKAKKAVLENKSLIQSGMPREIEEFFHLAGVANFSNLETLVLPLGLQQFKQNFDDLRVICRPYPRITRILDSLEVELEPVLRAKLAEIQSLTPEMLNHPTLRAPGSSARQILQAISNFSDLSQEEQRPGALLELMGQIETLSHTSKKNRSNPFARTFMGGSSKLYEDILEVLKKPHEDFSLADSSSMSEEVETSEEEESKFDVLEESAEKEVNSNLQPQAAPRDIDWVSLRRETRAKQKERALLKKEGKKDSYDSLPSTPQAPDSSKSPERRDQSLSSSLPHESKKADPLPSQARLNFRLSVLGKAFDDGKAKAVAKAKAEDPQEEKILQQEPAAENFAFISAAGERQILRAIETKHEAGERIPFKKMEDSSSSQEMLKILEQNMQAFERLQHPDPPWRYTRIEPELPGEKVIIKLEYFPDHLITQKELDQKRKYSLMTRKLSLIGGILTLLDSPTYLTADPEQKNAIRQYLAKLVNEVNELEVVGDAKEEIDNFVLRLVEDLGELIEPKPKNIVREFREAERYFVAEHNQNRVLLNVIHRDDEEILQLDIGLHHQLNQEQREAYLQIHSQSKPAWFLALSEAEKEWYLQRIPNPSLDPPQQMAEKWAKFAVLFKSSAMPHTPGLSNARVNYLMLQKEGGLEILSASLKCGTPVSYEMPKSERAAHSRANAERMVEVTEELAKRNFAKLWGPLFQGGQTQPRVPVLIQSLLSEKIVKGRIEWTAADKRLIDGQREAMKEVKSEDFSLRYHNDGTNAYSRGNLISMKKNPECKALVVEAKNFLKAVFNELKAQEGEESGFDAYIVDLLFLQQKNKPDGQRKLLENMLAKIEKSPHLSPEQKAAVTILIRVLDEYYHEKPNQSKLSRNKAEYIISLKHQLVQAMGGACSDNCKSGKDRTGQSEAYQHAFTLHTVLYSSGQALLHFDEVGERRATFCQQAAEINAAGKAQEAAAMNTPGSFGTKSTGISMIIDDGIVNCGEFQKLHPLGCELAGMNKPAIFVADEEKKTKEQQKADMRQEMQTLKTDAANSEKEEAFSLRGASPDFS